MRLSQATLADLPTGIVRPEYDRSQLTPGIVHIGLGNFHRAHQAWYLHRLMQVGEAHDWAIIGAGVRPNDEAQRKLLKEQDYLTTLVELDPKGRSAEIVGSMIGYVPVKDDNGPLIEKMAHPDIRIVSLTVTEGGYYVDPVSKQFDVEHPDVLHDARNPDRPRTAFGAIVAALKQRRSNGQAPFTCQSCDNLQGNGDVLKNTILGLARLSDVQLADWIEENGAFPNSMVDCIVPATGQRELKLVARFGVSDAAPVTHENFRQWVIEDNFCAGRPAWEDAGATLTEDVHGFEAMKIRILNAGHSIIAEAGQLLGIETIAECMAHPYIGAYLRKVQLEEIVPTILPVPTITAESYTDLVGRRFSNPYIVDTTRRVASGSSAKHPEFLHPIIREQLVAGRSINGLALAEACWARFCKGTRVDGSMIDASDPNWESLKKTAAEAESRPRVWLEQRPIYGDLAEHAEFTNAFSYWLNAIFVLGLDAAISEFLGNSKIKHHAVW